MTVGEVFIPPTYRSEEPDFLSKKAYEERSAALMEYTALKQNGRGWTDALIHKYLGNPDYLVDQRGTITSIAAIDRSPYIIRLFLMERVQRAKSTDAWKSEFSKVTVQRSARQLVKEKPENQRLTCILCEHERAMREVDSGWKCKYCGYETRSLD